VYKQQTEPLIDYYSKKGVLQNIDGMGDVKVVFNRILSFLKD